MFKSRLDPSWEPCLMKRKAERLILVADLKAVLNPTVVETLKKHMYRFAGPNLPRDQWKEAMGVLVGYIKKDIYITHAVPLLHGTDVDFEFGPKELVLFDRIDQTVQAQDLLIMGWYHSHPNIGIFLSPDDVKNHLVYLTFNPKAIALVFDHTKAKEENLGFKIFYVPDPNNYSYYEEISFEVAEIKLKKKQKGITPDSLMFLEEFLTELHYLADASKEISVAKLESYLDLTAETVDALIKEAIKEKSLPGTLDQDKIIVSK